MASLENFENLPFDCVRISRTNEETDGFIKTVNPGLSKTRLNYMDLNELMKRIKIFYNFLFEMLLVL